MAFLDNSGDIILDADGDNINFKAGGTDIASFAMSPTSSSLEIDAFGDFTVDSAGDIILDVAGGDVELKNAGNTAGKITVGDASDPSVTLDVTGEITLDADAGNINLNDGGTAVGQFQLNDNNHLKLLSKVSDADIFLQGNDGGSTITALRLDMSDAGKATFNAGADFSNTLKITRTGTDDAGILLATANANRYIASDQDGVVSIGTGTTLTGGTQYLSIDSGSVAISASARIAQVALTSSSNAVAWDAKAAANAYHVTTENTTFSAPSNAVEGAVISVELAQGGTARTIAWNTVFEFAASTAPTVTATANKTDIFTFRYNGSVWQEIGRVQNMAQT